MRNYLVFLWATHCCWNSDKILKRQPASGLQKWCWVAILNVSSKGIETRALFESVSVRLTYRQGTLPVEYDTPTNALIVYHILI